MFGHYLLTLYRTLTRHRLYAALNVLGLAVGIAVFLLLMLYVRFETSFDRWIPDARNIYRFTSAYTFPGRPTDHIAMSTGALVPAFRGDYPDAGEITRMLDAERPVQNGTLLGTEHTAYADMNLFNVLDLPLLAGDRHTALAEPGNAIVTQSVAQKYFGHSDVLGRSLILFYHGKPIVHRITGVLRDIPQNSSLKVSVIAPLTSAMLDDPQTGLNLWGAPTCFTYVRFKGPVQSKAVIADLRKLVQRRAHDPGPLSDISRLMSVSLVPLTDLHFADAKFLWPMRPGVDERLVYAIGLVGALTLGIAILNHVNLATARAALRAKEIALRKVIGATRASLMVQLLAEATALAFVAVLIGLALTALSLPALNAQGGVALSIAYWSADSILPIALGLSVVIGLGAGLYPALLLSRYAPAPVLASARSPGGGREGSRLRGVLIGAQFVVAIAFTICTLVIGSQARFIREADRGFQRSGLIILSNLGTTLLAQRQSEILDTLRRVPGVVSVTASLREPGLPGEDLMQVHLPGAKRSPVLIAYDLVTDQYLKTYGAKLVAGRMFDRQHGADDVAGAFKGPNEAAARGIDVIVNETAARDLGFASPSQAVGQRIFTGDMAVESVPIIGVIHDLQFGSPRQPVDPVVYRYDSQAFGNGAVGAVRFVGVSNALMMARLRTVWFQAAPMVPFRGETAEQGLRDFYVPDEQRSRLFTVGSVLAIMIACVGLYGLASFNTARRYREIGIRKTLGASTTEVLGLILAQMLQPVLIANLVAWPLAWLSMRGWLAGFAQRIALSPLFFLGTSLLALAVAGLTVSAQAFSLARAEPAKALRYE